MSYGLLNKNFQNQRLPLVASSVSATIVDYVADITVSQVYRNATSESVDTIFIFPLSGLAAEYDFEAIFDDKKIMGVSKKKSEIPEILDPQEGYSLDSVKSDIFHMNVGFIPPMKDVEIKLKYVIELQFVLDETGPLIQFSLPMAVAPIHQASQEEVPQPRSDLEIVISALFSSQILAVNSPTHFITTVIDETPLQNEATCELVKGVPYLQTDFLLYFRINRTPSPKAWGEILRRYLPSGESETSRAIMISFFPSFDFTDINTEVIFIIDRSSSMGFTYGGVTPLLEAKEAIKTALDLLSENVLFNIIEFGNLFSSLFVESVPCTEENKETALFHCEYLESDFGGTDLLRPLQHIFNLSEGRSRTLQIFLITDGEITNIPECLDLISKHSGSTRLFALGIGPSANANVLRSLARAGSGTADIAVSDQEHAYEILSRQVKRALQPALTHVSLEWKDSSMKTFQTPQHLNPIFNNDYYSVFSILDNSIPSDQEEIQATLKARTPTGTEVVFPILVNFITEGIEGGLIHRITAASLIRDLDQAHVTEDVKYKDLALELALRFNLFSDETTYVAIEEAEGGETLIESCGSIDHSHPGQTPTSEQTISSIPSRQLAPTMSFSSDETIPELLMQGSLTLEMLLDHPDILQETNAQNWKLMEFFYKKTTLHEFMKYISDEPMEELSENRTKYGLLSFMILSLETLPIGNSFCRHEDLLLKLFSFFLKEARQGDPFRYQEFSARIASVYLKLAHPQVIAFLQKYKIFSSPYLAQHLLNEHVVDFVFTLSHCEYIGTLQCISESNLLDALIEQFDPAILHPELEAISEVFKNLIAYATSQNSSLVEQIESVPLLTKLFSYMLAGGLTDSLNHGLTILIELLRRYTTSNEPLWAHEAAEQDLPPLLQMIYTNLPRFVEFLPFSSAHSQPTKFKFSVGSVQPIGFCRLKLVEFFSYLSYCNSQLFDEALHNLGVVNSCLDMFFQQPFNNFLHFHVGILVEGLLSSPDEVWKLKVVKESRLLERICEASDENETSISKPKGFRLPHMGHVILLSSVLLNRAETEIALKEFLDSDPRWQAYISGPYNLSVETQSMVLAGLEASEAAYWVAYAKSQRQLGGNNNHDNNSEEQEEQNE